MAEWSSGIAWSRDFETGNEAIDEQHKQLFKLTSDLADAAHFASDSLEETLDFLVAYTVKHFADEEALQVKYIYPGYNHHKELHDKFKETVGDLVTRFKEGGDSAEENAKSLSAKVNSVIVRWLIQHIQKEDAKIGAHIRKVNAPH